MQQGDGLSPVATGINMTHLNNQWGIGCALIVVLINMMMYHGWRWVGFSGLVAADLSAVALVLTGTLDWISDSAEAALYVLLWRIMHCWLVDLKLGFLEVRLELGMSVTLVAIIGTTILGSFKSSLCNSFENRAPINEIYGCPIFRWWRLDSMRGYQDRSPSNGHQVTRPIICG